MDIERLSRAASELPGNMDRAGVPMQKGVATLFNRLAKREAMGLLGMEPEKPRRRKTIRKRVTAVTVGRLCHPELLCVTALFHKVSYANIRFQSFFMLMITQSWDLA